MKKSFKLALSSLALLAFGLSACNQESSANKKTDYSYNNKLVQSVTLSSEYEQCEIGDSFTLHAEINFKNDEEVEVYKEWKSSKTSVARVVANDNLAVVEVVGSGTSYITFRAGYEMAKCKVYVPDPVDPTPDPDPDPDPQPQTDYKITLSITSRTMQVGDEFNLTASVSPLADASFVSSNTNVISIGTQTTSACTVTAVGEGEADVVVTAEDATAKCHVTVYNSQEEGDKEYTIYFYIDYNNVDPKDNTKLLSKFDWYYDQPLAGAKDEQGKSLIPTVTNDMAMDPAFPYFIGWSTHPIIDTKDNLWDLNKDTVADLPMMSYTVTLYGQWMDVPVLPA